MNNLLHEAALDSKRDVENKSKTSQVRRIISICVVITILLSAMMLGDGSSPFIVSQAAAFSDAPFGEVFNMLSDPDTSNIMCTDHPAFSNQLDENGFPVENGRIWVDKSVNTDKAIIFEQDGKTKVDSILAQPDEFLVTLSALSQAFTIDTIFEPSDTVFVIDISTSMRIYQVDGHSQISILVDALNMAMKTIMEANPANRIAVVAYGGRTVTGQSISRVVPILRLGHHHVPYGTYFSLSTTPLTATINVNPLIPNEALFTPAARSVLVDGGTPTQRGIYYGARVLLDVLPEDTRYTKTVNNEDFTVIRRPNIILMTDGEPTMGWTNYRFSANDPDGTNHYPIEGTATERDASFNVGDATPQSAEMGLSLLTALTASYMKQLIHNHYFGDYANRKVGFYTIGFGIDDPLVHAAMDPFGRVHYPPGAVNADVVNLRFDETDYNMRILLDQFVSEGKITFPALNRGSINSRSLRTITNTLNDDGTFFVSTANFADLYRSAMNTQELENAFLEIANYIISFGSYSTKIEPGVHPDYSGYLVFSDVLGRYMEFRGFYGMWYQNYRHQGLNFSRDIVNDEPHARADFIRLLLDRQYDTERTAITSGQALDLLMSNLMAGEIGSEYGGLYYRSDSDFSNRILYYSDANRNFVGSFFNLDGTPATRPANAMAVVELYTMRGYAINPVTGMWTDLRNIAVYVITALEDGEFECAYAGGVIVRDLSAGDQVIRWYIPASLIPLRKVTPVVDGEGILVPNEPPKIEEASPLRLMYSVGLNRDRILAGISGEYRADLINQAGTNTYHFYTNSWWEQTGFSNCTIAFFRANEANPFYNHIRIGERQGKSDNVTGTANFVWESNSFELENKVIHVYQLGNNGRMTIPFTSLTAEKVWELPCEDSFDYVGVDWIKPEWVQLFGNEHPAGVPNPLGIPRLLDPGATEELTAESANPSVKVIWDTIPLFDLVPNEMGNATRVEYTVLEGTFTNNVLFTPYGPDNEPNPFFQISHTQPEWNDEIGVWEAAKILNFVQYVYFTVTYVCEHHTSGEVPRDDVKYQPDEKVTVLDSGSLVRGGYRFIGWSTNRDGTGDIFVPGDTFDMPEHNVILYAQWEPNLDYSVTYVCEYHTDGEVPRDDRRYKPGEEVIVLDSGSLVREGYRFLGWSTSRDGTGDIFVQGDTFDMPEHNVILYAQWEPEDDPPTDPDYSVTYVCEHHTDGEVPRDENRYQPDDEVVVLDSGSLVRSGYRFIGWSTSRDGTGDTFVPGDTFDMPEHNVILYAQWEPLEPDPDYSVTYVCEHHTGGEVPRDENRYQPGDEVVVLDSGSLVRSGYRFIGWNTSRDGTGDTFVPGDTFDMPASDVILYAQWEPIRTTPNFTPTPRPDPTPDPTPEPEPEPEPEPLLQRQAYLIGMPSGEIRPEGDITRAEIATIFFRLVSDDLREIYWSQEHPYDDVHLTNWYNNAVGKTTKMGLFQGVSEGLFAPDQPITRAELAAVMVRFYADESIASYSEIDDMFNDIDGHWARAYINFAASRNWIQGPTGLSGPFQPNQPVTRAETAAMINRTFNRLVEHPDDLHSDMITWPDNQNEDRWYYLYVQSATNSYTYEWKACGVFKYWLEIIEPRDWAVLERPTSRPEDIFRTGLPLRI